MGRNKIKIIVTKNNYNCSITTKNYWVSLKIHFFCKKVGGVSPKRRITVYDINKL
ncbi:MAG: hypothetical protein LBP59_14480 [Planctomycetaceae bacterium]|nr:hypothetical protein [Planctomycetaceae bacterium]